MGTRRGAKVIVELFNYWRQLTLALSSTLPDFKKKSGHYCFNSKEFVSSQYETKREVKYVYIRAKYS